MLIGPTTGFQPARPAAQALGGAAIPLGERWTLSGEYRYSWARIDADLGDGWRLETSAVTHHLNIGIGFRFGASR